MGEVRMPVKHKGRLRGDVVCVLNRLVHEGLIREYVTNLSGEQTDLALTVTRGAGETSEDELRCHIQSALAHLVADVAVVVTPDGRPA